MKRYDMIPYRFETLNGVSANESPTGAWVKYSDAQAEIETQRTNYELMIKSLGNHIELLNSEANRLRVALQNVNDLLNRAGMLGSLFKFDGNARAIIVDALYPDNENKEVKA